MKAFGLWASCPDEPSLFYSAQCRPLSAAIAAAGATALFGISALPLMAASPIGLANPPMALIHSIKVGRHANRVTLSLAGSGLLKANVHPGRLPNSIDVDVKGKPLFVPASAHVGYGGVNAIHYGWLCAAPPELRIIVTARSRMDWRVEPHSGSLSVMLWKAGSTILTPAARPALQPKVAARITLPSSPVAPALSAGNATSSHVILAARVATPAAPVFHAAPVVLHPSPVVHPTMVAQVSRNGSVVASGGFPGAGVVTLNVKDASIEDVLKALADQSGTNIVAASGVTGNVSIKLKNVTVDQALRLITRLNKLSYQRDPNTNTIVVGSPDELRAFGPSNEPPVIVTLARTDST
ncbi:MAG TPA: secretin and TonB N-terminal domain-containing protein, partial [Armatimonadota bacterium]|nr:secretin and TonB N-terminal domain-containing protein [Armatimonadota bacterium]